MKKKVTHREWEIMCREDGLDDFEKRASREHDFYFAAGKSSKGYTVRWAVGYDEQIRISADLHFDLFHDINLESETRRLARFQSALIEAEGFVNRMERNNRG